MAFIVTVYDDRSHTAFQDDCLLVYCALVWRTVVLMCMHATTVSLDFQQVCY